MEELTKRQEQILRLIQSGKTYKDISSELKITKQSVKTHAFAIRRKMGLQGRP